MADGIILSRTPEELKYTQYLGEIEMRRRRVAELQTELGVLKEELGRFNAEYHSRVGTLFVELDKLDLAIADYEFRIARLTTATTLDPDELERETHTHFAEQRDRLHHDEEKTQRHQRTFVEDRRRPALDDASAAALKSVYRELVKRFHPDLARTEVERQQREAVMKRINAAFHERDVGQLRSLLDETEIEDAAFEFRSTADKLVWAIRELSRLDGVIADMTGEIETLKASDLAVLWQRCQTGERVLEFLERDLNQRIEVRRRVLQGWTEEFFGQVKKGNNG